MLRYWECRAHMLIHLVLCWECRAQMLIHLQYKVLIFIAVIAVNFGQNKYDIHVYQPQQDKDCIQCYTNTAPNIQQRLRTHQKLLTFYDDK